MNFIQNSVCSVISGIPSIPVIDSKSKKNISHSRKSLSLDNSIFADKGISPSTLSAAYQNAKRFLKL